LNQDCWKPSRNGGFLMHPDPVADISACDAPIDAGHSSILQELATGLPELISTKRLRTTLDELPIVDCSALQHWPDSRVAERAFQIYSHFANVYVWCDQDDPASRLPAGVAVPLVQLAAFVDRPPILPYAATALCNYERIDPDGEYRVENLRVIQKIIDIPDESWFHLTHAEIEAHAGDMLFACIDATAQVDNDDAASVEQSLGQIPDALGRMMVTFKGIAKGCKPETYFHTLRPYLFGFENIVYEGVQKYAGEPQTFRGQTGAQSSAIPAAQAFLGLRHEHGGLTHHLEVMKAHMPKPHRELLAAIDSNKIRDYVASRAGASLTETYNECLQSLTEFRTLHLGMAHAFVASRVENPIGTGGTEFMHWLEQLRNETEQQFL
jgi:indoleamine 2,3-dioxygenase